MGPPWAWRSSICFFVIIYFCSHVIYAASVGRGKSTLRKVTIQMIGYSPTQKDDYVAVQMPAEPGYIVGFEPLAHADRVHHMLLYGCEDAPSAAQFWKGMSTCGYGASHILYAWARNAPNLNLPQNVAFSIGNKESSIKVLVLQVHYAQPFAGNVLDFSGITLHVVDEPPTHLAAVLLFVSGTPIPPRMQQFQSNMSCEFSGTTEIHPFAFRTHTHAMGRVVSGYVKHNGQWTKVGKRNPQWPQLFEPIQETLTIRKGDLMAASCRFDSHDTNETTPMGHMGTNEMCNFYMMFYWDATKENPFPYGAVCGGYERMDEFAAYPTEGFELLPARPELEHHARQSGRPFGVVEEAKFHTIEGIKLGQISGLAFDNNQNLVIFHRGSRVWDGSTFDAGNHLLDKRPIAEPTLLVASIEGNTSRIVKKLGESLFFLPHGVFVDVDDFIYTTDVGAHTVTKWKINGDKLVEVWRAGEQLVPGSDHSHFCKPTAITRVGSRLFVSDGYCNARIVELSLDGKYKAQFGAPGTGEVQFQLPHDIAISDRNTLIVADRQNGRVQELTVDGGLKSMTASTLFSNIYSSHSFQDAMFMVPGEVSYNRLANYEQPIQVFSSRLGTGLLEFAFAPTSAGFARPHVVRVSPTGNHIFVGDISEEGATLWKFKVQHDSSTESLTHDSAGYAKAAFDSLSRNAPSSSTSFFAFLLMLGGIGGVWWWIRKRRRGPQSLFDRKRRGKELFKSKEDRKLDCESRKFSLGWGFKPLNQEDTVAFFASDSESD